MFKSVSLLFSSSCSRGSPASAQPDAVWSIVDAITEAFPEVPLWLSVDRSATHGHDACADEVDSHRAMNVELSLFQDPALDVHSLDARIRNGARTSRCRLRLVAHANEIDLCVPVLTRYQLHLPLPPSTANDPLLEAVLRAHGLLYDLEKPLQLADYEHALDTWRWLLRLDPGADLACQIAALFHDVERLTVEADVRVEHHAPDYDAFKRAHALHGAEITRQVLLDLGLSHPFSNQVCDFVARHEQPDAQPECASIADADALSFFSLNSPGFLDYFGPEHTRRKIAYSLRRMRPASRDRVARLWLRHDVRRLLESVGVP